MTNHFDTYMSRKTSKYERRTSKPFFLGGGLLVVKKGIATLIDDTRGHYRRHAAVENF